MNSLPLQRRLDALARDVESMRDTLAAVALRVEAGGPPNPAATADALLAARRARTEALGSGLFADPAWDMLLALVRRRRTGRGAARDAPVRSPPGFRRPRRCAGSSSSSRAG
jgi:hypothetical protein